MAITAHHTAILPVKARKCAHEVGAKLCPSSDKLPM